TQEESIPVFKEKKIKQLSLNDIFYFEAVDNKTFVYSATDVYQTNLKLYELEVRLTNSYFIRTSKSLILNVMKIEHVTPAFNSRFEAELENKEKIIISRKFAPLLKKKLGI
ncbi:LytTR family DNA-binding domain-containing protein, partial [Carnobacterium sp.]